MPHHIIQSGCVQCQACIPTCPYGAIQEKKGIIFVEPSLCIDCQACREPCPTNCFSILDEKSAREEINRLFAHTTPSENPNPNKDAESSQKGESSENQNPSDKDNKGEGQKSEGDSSQKSEQDSSTGNAESSDKDKQDSLLPPPPTQITSSIKILQEITTLQSYLATIK